MTDSFVERERRFEVGDDFEVPDLQGAVPPGSVLLRSVQQLRSDYYDTPDHAVRRAGMTLRRRTGTDDVGWHLELPLGEHRAELRFDLSEVVPSAVTRLLLGVTRGAELAVVASLETERHVTRVVDAAGDPVADIDLDHVRASVPQPSGSATSSWTELEVELGSPSVSDEQLSVLGRRLRDAGARPSREASKLSRAFRDAGAGPAVEARPKGEKKRKPKGKGRTKRQRSGAVLLPYLEEQQRVLLLGDVALRRGDDRAIHRTRVATRRLRSALRVFGAFFDAERSAALDASLRWYAEVLGAVRDSQVLELRLHEALAETPPELVLGPVQQHIDAHLHAMRQRAWERLQQELTGRRYLDLLAEVAAWTDETPFTGRADRPASEVVRASRRARRTVARRLRAANRSGDVDQLHRARKAAKRARYAAEAARSVTGDSAVREADRYRRLQDLLGEHQDSVVSARLLRELGAAAGVGRGENGFTFGLLYQREQQRAAVARRKAQRAARRDR